jgi:hypothetical protein
MFTKAHQWPQFICLRSILMLAQYPCLGISRLYSSPHILKPKCCTYFLSLLCLTVDMPTHPPCFDRPNNNSWNFLLLKPLITHIPPFFCYFFLHRSKNPSKTETLCKISQCDNSLVWWLISPLPTPKIKAHPLSSIRISEPSNKYQGKVQQIRDTYLHI